MGCKQSNIKGGDGLINPHHLPEVPPESWYAQSFMEPTEMVATPFHTANKGKVLFATTLIPTKLSDLQNQPDPGNPSNLAGEFQYGRDPIYGMSYLHSTALFIEHYWRTRVVHTFNGAKFDRPGYNMLLGVKVFIDDALVPDQDSKPDSLLQCTTTLFANEATKLWICVPVVLFADLTDPMLSVMDLYRPLVHSFAKAVEGLAVGPHDVRVEVVYGCRAEANFCTDFIARGSFVMQVTEESLTAARTISAQLEQIMAVHAATQVGAKGEPVRETILLCPPERRPANPCAYCSAPLKYSCTVCGANVCGSTGCVWSKFLGYPHGCATHKAQ